MAWNVVNYPMATDDHCQDVREVTGPNCHAKAFGFKEKSRYQGWA
jgi:hypothetical protein